MDELIEIQPDAEINKRSALPRISGDWIIFLMLWPFGALLNALRRFREPCAKTVFWLFCIYYGFVLIYANPYGKGGADSARDAKQLIDWHNTPDSFENLLSMFYNPQGGFTDVYLPLVTWLMALFTGDPRFMFAVFAAVFGFFYAQNLWMIFSRVNVKIGLTLFLFMFAYALINPIWEINGVRMWTAAQIFLYGALIYFLNGDKRGMIWSALSTLVHFSFIFPVALFLIYVFSPRNLLLFFAFYIATCFISEINIDFVRNSLSFLPDVFQGKMKVYTSEASFQRVFMENQGFASYVRISWWVGKLVVYAWVIASFFNRRKWNPYLPDGGKFFGFALFIGGFAQIAQLFPSGTRFITVANSLFYAVFVLFLINLQTDRKLGLLKIVTIPLLVYLIIFQIRAGFEFTGILTFLGNPILAIFSTEQLPLIDSVKRLFNYH